MELDILVFEGFNKGDGNCFKKVKDFYWPEMLYYGWSLIKNKFEAEDILVRVFQKAWNMRGQFTFTTNLKAFLFITTKNECFNWLRHLKCQKKWDKEHFYLEEDSIEPDYLNKIIQAEIFKEIVDSFEEMPEKRRVVVRLAFLVGMSNAEIANELNLSIHTIKEHKCKAMEWLRMRFNPNAVPRSLKYRPLFYHKNNKNAR